jgi:hypothetical protein
MMMWIILIEEQRNMSVRSLFGCIVPEKVSGTDEDNTETSSRSTVGFCSVNRMVTICSFKVKVTAEQGPAF